MNTVTTPVVGTQFSEYKSTDQATYTVGDQITIRLDPSNPYDKKACAVIHTASGARIGYIPRDTPVQDGLISGKLQKQGIITAYKPATRKPFTIELPLA